MFCFSKDQIAVKINLFKAPLILKTISFLGFFINLRTLDFGGDYQKFSTSVA